MTMGLPILKCGNCEELKLGVHATALGLAALCGLYNAAAWLSRREQQSTRRRVEVFYNDEQRSFLGDHRWAVLATGRRDGSPQQAMVGYALDAEGRLLVSTRRDSAKWLNVLRKLEVSLTVPDGRVHLVVYGRAETIEADPDRAELSADVLAVVRGPERPDPSSIVPWLEQARVAVVPLRIGSGTRLKALEAMSAGRPVAFKPEGKVHFLPRAVAAGGDTVAALLETPAPDKVSRPAELWLDMLLREYDDLSPPHAHVNRE